MNEQVHLLDALARFLGEQVQPAIQEPGLSFRVRIAGWLLAGLARELRLGEQHHQAQAGRLAAVLGVQVPELEGHSLEAWLLDADRDLAQRLRTDALDDAMWTAARSHVQASLNETLDALQPTFDRRVEIENPRKD